MRYIYFKCHSIKYDKKPPKEDDSFVGIHNGLSRKSFDFVYKIASKFDLDNADAKLENGLLHIVTFLLFLK